MIRLGRIGHVLISLRDVERSKAFCTQILGTREIFAQGRGDDDKPLTFERPAKQ